MANAHTTKLRRGVRWFLLREITLLPLAVFLIIGFRSGDWPAGEIGQVMRWHPAFLWSGPFALLGLIGMWRRLPPAEPLAVGVNIFLTIGALGTLQYLYCEHNAFTLAVHRFCSETEHAGMYIAMSLVFLVFSLTRCGWMFDRPDTAPKIRLAALLLTVSALAASTVSIFLHEYGGAFLPGVVPFFIVLLSRLALMRTLLRDKDTTDQ